MIAWLRGVIRRRTDTMPGLAMPAGLAWPECGCRFPGGHWIPCTGHLRRLVEAVRRS